MDARTLKALNGSIRKWWLIAEGRGVDLGIANCHLCKLFYGVFCHGCPVEKESHEDGCEGTPYVAWSKKRTPGGCVITEKQQWLALDMWLYLVSLLPEGGEG